MDILLFGLGKAVSNINEERKESQGKKSDKSNLIARLFLSLNLIVLSVAVNYDTSLNYYCNGVLNYITDNCYDSELIYTQYPYSPDEVICDDGKRVINSIEAEEKYYEYLDNIRCDNCTNMRITSYVKINKYNVKFNNSYECSKNLCLLTTCGLSPSFVPIVNTYDEGDMSIFGTENDTTCELSVETTIDETSEVVFSAATYNRNNVNEGRFQLTKSFSTMLLTISMILMSVVDELSSMLEDKSMECDWSRNLMCAMIVVPVGMLGYFLCEKYMVVRIDLQVFYLVVLQTTIWLFMIQQMSDVKAVDNLFSDLVMRIKSDGHHCGKMIRGRVEVEELLADRIGVIERIRGKLKVDLVITGTCLIVNSVILTIEMYKTATGDFLRYSLVVLFIDSFIVTILIMFKIASFNSLIERVSMECGFKTNLEILIMSAQISVSLIISVSITFINNVLLKVDENSKICGHVS